MCSIRGVYNARKKIRNRKKGVYIRIDPWDEETALSLREKNASRSRSPSFARAICLSVIHNYLKYIYNINKTSFLTFSLSLFLSFLNIFLIVQWFRHGMRRAVQACGVIFSREDTPNESGEKEKTEFFYWSACMYEFISFWGENRLSFFRPRNETGRTQRAACFSL